MLHVPATHPIAAPKRMNTLFILWLRLTGGEHHCPRGRFALTMLVAYGLYHMLLPEFIHCFVMLELHGSEFSLVSGSLLLLGLILAALGLLLVFLPLSPLALLGVESTLHECYEVTKGAAAATATVPEALWPYWCGFLCGAPVLLLAAAVALGAAWRRLQDAGRSPLFLLLGLTYLLGFDYSGSYAAESAGIYLLGPLWLIILYSQSGRKQEGFPIFRPLP